MNGVAPREMAAALARQAGRDTPIGVAPLEGGRNNRVFRVDFADAPTAVLKWYHSDPRDPRDRLKAEWEFLAHVNRLGIPNVPRPLAARREYRAAFYSFVPGTRAAAVTESSMRKRRPSLSRLTAVPPRTLSSGAGVGSLLFDCRPCRNGSTPRRSIERVGSRTARRGRRARLRGRPAHACLASGEGRRRNDGGTRMHAAANTDRYHCGFAIGFRVSQRASRRRWPRYVHRFRIRRGRRSGQADMRLFLPTRAPGTDGMPSSIRSRARGGVTP